MTNNEMNKFIKKLKIYFNKVGYLAVKGVDKIFLYYYAITLIKKKYFNKIN